MIVHEERKPDYLLLSVALALTFAGLVMVYSASFVEAFTAYDTQFYYLLRQVISAAIGSVGLLVALRLDYTVWRRFSVPLMAAVLVVLMLVLVLPASITEVNGARSWIRLGPLSVQPSEFAKLALLIYIADWLSRRGEKLRNVTFGLIPFAVMLGVVCGLVLLGGDLGTTVVLVVIGGVVYFAAGASVLHILLAAALAAGACYAMVIVAPYRMERIAAWQDPWAYYSGAGFQPLHAQFALGSGGIFGEGLGQARQKFNWLPQAHTDTIFAIIGEELGLVGTVLVVLCFLVIAHRGFRIAARCQDPFAALLALGITSWLVFQALINMAVVTGLIPFTGLTLPFLAYGGSSLMVSLVAIGILLNISKQVGEARGEARGALAYSGTSVRVGGDVPTRAPRRRRGDPLGLRRLSLALSGLAYRLGYGLRRALGRGKRPARQKVRRATGRRSGKR
jgi:cell division protein FtsW